MFETTGGLLVQRSTDRYFFSSEMDPNPDNPSPFKGPFLVLHFENEGEWVVDVEGEIQLYLLDFTPGFQQAVMYSTGNKEDQIGWISQATPLMNSILIHLRGFHHPVKQICVYSRYEKGDIKGPTHLLRNGAFFSRMDLRNPVQGSTEYKHRQFHDVAADLRAASREPF
jgi:hypothetical protein